MVFTNVLLLFQHSRLPTHYTSCNVTWFQVLSDETVTRLFSRSWVVREYGLRMLSRDAVTVLLLGVGEGRSGVQVSAERQENTRLMLECCFSVLTHMLADPVYKVFVAALVCLLLLLFSLFLSFRHSYVSANMAEASCFPVYPSVVSLSIYHLSINTCFTLHSVNGFQQNSA